MCRNDSCNVAYETEDRYDVYENGKGAQTEVPKQAAATVTEVALSSRPINDGSELDHQLRYQKQR